MLSTYRRTRLVLPTPNAPSMHTFFWSMRPSVARADQKSHAPIRSLRLAECAHLLGLERACAAHRKKVGRDPARFQHRAHDLGARSGESKVGGLLPCRIGMPDDHD